MDRHSMHYWFAVDHVVAKGIGLWLVALLLAACSSPAPTSTPGTPSPTVTAPTPAANVAPSLEGTFDVGGGVELPIVCYGDRAPTVILQPGGTDEGGVFEVPADLLRAIGEHTRACAYDRADLSAPYDQPPSHDMGQHVADLRHLLDAAGVPGPYIWAGTSMGGTFALASALNAPEQTAGLVIIDTDFPDPDPKRFCTFAGVSCKVDPEYLKADALAIGLGQWVMDRMHRLPGVPVRVVTSDKFTPGCYFEGGTCNEKRVNRRVVEFQKVGWGGLSRDFHQTIVHVYHDELLEGAQEQIVTAVRSVLRA